MDSMLLLHLFSTLFPQRVRAIYVDHQLQSLSKDWAQFVFQFCQKMNIPCVIERVVVQSGNLELQARQARYDAFKKNLQSNEILVLAHHQQDQAETLLLRLFSGAGVTGLSAMREIDRRADLTIWRPLLGLSRQQLLHWVTQFQLKFVDDPTNFDEHYDRAWARAILWPVLEQRFPKMQNSIARTAYLMQDADEILQEVVQQDIDACILNDKLDLEKFLKLSLPRQRNLLSFWMKDTDGYRPSLAMIERVQNEVIHARPDAKAALFCSPFWYTRFQEKLYKLVESEYLAQRYDVVQSESVYIIEDETLQLSSGLFRCQIENQIGLSEELLHVELQIRPRIDGEKVHLYGRVGHWPLKKAIQSAKILPWLRHRVQILQFKNVILGVFTPQGFWLAQSKYCKKNGWQPKLIKKH